ncbi:MAG: cytochrome P450 [Actinobacteria bacterium]|nr:cytochrome P450 [Actinomycetota bacterium]
MTTPAPRPSLRDTLRTGAGLNRDPGAALLDLYDRYGPVVDLGWGSNRHTLLLSPEANELILATDPANFTWRESFWLLVPVNGETALVVSDGDDHARRRRIVQPAFHRRRINTYASVMTEEADRELSTWRPGSTVDAYAAFRQVIRRIVVRCLFGDRFATNDAIVAPLETALGYVNRSPVRRFDHDLPGTAYRRAIRARAAVDELVFAEVEARRRGADETDDVLAWLVAAEDDGAGPTSDALTDQEVRDQVVSLIAAGYDTTSSAMGWSLYRLARHPQHAGAIREEVASAGGADSLDADDLAALPFTGAFVQEVLRHHSPAVMSGRHNVAPFEIHGCTVPAGTSILYSPWLTQHLPDQFRDPFEFRPGRWIPDHPDADAPHPYAHVPFGGGSRRCLGFAFATMELVLMTALAASRHELSWPSSTPPRPGGAVSMAPVGGLPLAVGPLDPVG